MFLHDYIFTELENVEVPVIDSTGILWAGPNRKGMNAPNPIDMWKARQKSVQKNMDDCHQRVRDYFQVTKYFSKPPKRHEAQE